MDDLERLRRQAMNQVSKEKRDIEHGKKIVYEKAEGDAKSDIDLWKNAIRLAIQRGVKWITLNAYSDKSSRNVHTVPGFNWYKFFTDHTWKLDHVDVEYHASYAQALQGILLFGR